MAEIGRLVSLGARRDRRDAASVLVIARHCARQLESTDGVTVRRDGAHKLIREASYYFFERPRQPAPALGAKYPLDYPWSPLAWGRISGVGRRPVGGWGLVLDHAIPIAVVRDEVLRRADALNADELAELLMKELGFAVISRAEDVKLNKMGVRSRQPKKAMPDDPWARYRLLGLTPEDFVVPSLVGN